MPWLLIPEAETWTVGEVEANMLSVMIQAPHPVNYVVTASQHQVPLFTLEFPSPRKKKENKYHTAVSDKKLHGSILLMS